MKTHLILIATLLHAVAAHAQICKSGRLDPRVATTLRTVLPDLSPHTSVEKVRDVKIEAPASFPLSDVQRLKITADSVPLQIYNPSHANGLPIIISYHPGGFVTPILPFMEYEFWRQAKVYHAVVFAADYRVAPEHPYPAAVNDAYNAFKWVLEHGYRYGGDTSKIMVLGMSAGGNLAAVVCQKAKRQGLAKKIKLQVLNCPSTDNPLNHKQHPSYRAYASGYFLTREFCLYYIGVYAPDVNVNNTEVAPLRDEDLSALPPALVITAEFDPLRDEGYAYAEKLKHAGVPVTYKCFAGQIHCLVGLPPDAVELKEVDQFVIGAMGMYLN